MEDLSFETLTRRLGKTKTRREALRVLFGAGVAAVVVACGGSVAPSGRKDECPTASACDARSYCNEEETCICVRTAEGNLRCGELPTTCDVALCETSADCEAALGVAGAFCDTPNSGCCTDPPAELPRCLLPCGTGAGVSPEASPYVSPAAASWSDTAAPHRDAIGERFAYVCPPDGQPGDVYGTDDYTDDSSVCTAAVHAGLITLAGGGTVTIEIRPGLESYAGTTRNGITSSGWGAMGVGFNFPAASTGGAVVPATVTCPAEDACIDVRLQPDNHGHTADWCADTGVAAKICGAANEDAAFTILAGRLIADGYRQVQPGRQEPIRLNAARAFGGGGLERTTFNSFFELGSDPSQTAELAYVETPRGESLAYAALISFDGASRVLTVSGDGTVSEEQVELPTDDGANFALAAYEPSLAFYHRCSDNCGDLCAAATTPAQWKLGMMASALICGASVVCAESALVGIGIGLVTGLSFNKACAMFCENYCEEVPVRVFCGCEGHGECFTDLGLCLNTCTVGLGCLGLICGPDPVCDAPLQKWKV